MDKLGLYINNLMATIVDREEKHFSRKLAFNELQRLNHDIGSFLIKWDDEFNEFKDDSKKENKNLKESNMDKNDKE